MSAHFLFAGAAALLTLAVVAWLLVPLLKRTATTTTATVTASTSRRALNAAIYRDQLIELDQDRATGSLNEADYDQARKELQHRLLQDAATADAAPEAAHPAKRTALALALLLPLGAALLYLWLGHPAAIDRTPAAPQLTAAQIDEMVAKLAARMEKDPDDPKGWIMLARSYKALRRFDEADKAFSKIGSTLDSDPDLLIEYADMLVMRAKGKLEGKPMELVQQALKLDPAHPMALAIAGSDAYNRKDFAAATRYWEALLKVLPPDSEDAASLTAKLTEIRDKMAAGKSGVGKSVQGTVALAPSLSDNIKPDDTLFIYAHAAEGSRMPLAILRKRAADLPVTFTLDDSLAVNPQMNLSSAKQIRIEARISKSGEATPQKGDLGGASGPIKSGSKGVRILIDRVIP